MGTTVRYRLSVLFFFEPCKDGKKLRGSLKTEFNAWQLPNDGVITRTT